MAASLPAEQPTDWPATAAAAAIRNGKTKSYDYLNQLLKRFDSELKFSNAVLVADPALSSLQNAVNLESAESTRTGKRFAANGPLACVPFALSPVADVKGYSTHGNNSALVLGKATTDAPVIYALKKAGAELFAFANASELNTKGLVAHPVQGLVKNVSMTAHHPY
jgi:Asp-tRNA(Asn)/Glu-tRNA(Gln) amidotransferase A subunit family amidase